MIHYGRRYPFVNDNVWDIASEILFALLYACHLSQGFGTDGRHAKAWHGWLHVLFLNVSIIKWCYFGSVVERIESYLYIIKECLFAMKWFTALVMFFSFCFSVMYMGAGVDEPGGDGHTGDQDFPGLGPSWSFFLYGISNSVGDLNPLEFEDAWTYRDETGDCTEETACLVPAPGGQDYPFTSKSMIGLGLSIYYFQIVMMVVLLLNLLISIFGDKYNDATAS